MEGRRKGENVEEYGNISWNVEKNGNNELSSRKYESLYMNLGIIIIIFFYFLPLVIHLKKDKNK